jgi:hypothetical protein
MGVRSELTTHSVTEFMVRGTGNEMVYLTSKIALKPPTVRDAGVIFGDLAEEAHRNRNTPDISQNANAEIERSQIERPRSTSHQYQHYYESRVTRR